MLPWWVCIQLWYTGSWEHFAAIENCKIYQSRKMKKRKKGAMKEGVRAEHLLGNVELDKETVPLALHFSVSQGNICSAAVRDSCVVVPELLGIPAECSAHAKEGPIALPTSKKQVRDAHRMGNPIPSFSLPFCPSTQSSSASNTQTKSTSFQKAWLQSKPLPSSSQRREQNLYCHFFLVIVTRLISAVSLSLQVRRGPVPPVPAGALEVLEDGRQQAVRVHAREAPRRAGHGLRHVPQDLQQMQEAVRDEAGAARAAMRDVFPTEATEARVVSFVPRELLSCLALLSVYIWTHRLIYPQNKVLRGNGQVTRRYYEGDNAPAGGLQ